MASETQHAHGSFKSHTSKLVNTVSKDAKPLQAFISKFNNDLSMTFAGILAFNLLTAISPIAVAIFGILGLVLGNNSDLQQTIAHAIAGVLPSSPGDPGKATAAQLAIDQALKQLANDAGILLIIAIVLAVFGGSRLFITLESCLDLIYRVRPRTMLRQNLMAIGMLLLFVILVPIMVFASSGPSFLFELLANTPLRYLPGASVIFSTGNVVGLSIGSILGGLIVAFILFEAIYFFVPNKKVSFRSSWRGALMAAVALEVFFVLFPFYVTRFLNNYAGQIGFAVILLLFFYYFAVILLLGAQLNAFFWGEIRPLPNDLVTFVSTMGGKLNHDTPPTEGTPHQDSGPTDRADDAHIAEARAKDADIRAANRQLERQVVMSANSNPAQPTRSGNKAATALSVLLGTTLAFLMQTLRLRQRNK